MVHWALGFMVFLLVVEVYLAFSTHYASRVQNERVAEMVLKDPNTFFPLSEKAKTYIEEICAEKELSKKPVLLTGVYIQGVGKEDFLSILGLDNVMLSIPQEKAKILNELLEKEFLSDEEQDSFNEITFLISHEVEHLKKYASGSYFSVLSFDKVLSIFKLILFLLVVEFLLWLGASLGISIFTSWILVACFVFLLRMVNTCSEEYMCDLNSSKNPAVLRAGARWMEKEALPFSQNLVRTNFLGNFFNAISPDFACAFSTIHPHPMKRARRLRDRAEKLN